MRIGTHKDKQQLEDKLEAIMQTYWIKPEAIDSPNAEVVILNIGKFFGEYADKIMKCESFDDTVHDASKRESSMWKKFSKLSIERLSPVFITVPTRIEEAVSSKLEEEAETVGSNKFPLEFVGSTVVKNIAARLSEKAIMKTSKVVLLGKVKAKGEVAEPYIVDELATAENIKVLEKARKKELNKAAKTGENLQATVDDVAVPPIYFPIGTEFLVHGIVQDKVEIRRCQNSDVRLFVGSDEIELCKAPEAEKISRKRDHGEIVVQLPVPNGIPFVVVPVEDGVQIMRHLATAGLYTIASKSCMNIRMLLEPDRIFVGKAMKPEELAIAPYGDGLTLKKPSRSGRDSVQVSVSIVGPNFIRSRLFWVPGWTQAGKDDLDAVPPVYVARSPFWVLRTITRDPAEKCDYAHDEVRLVKKIQSIDCTENVTAKELLKRFGGKSVVTVILPVYTNLQQIKAGTNIFPPVDDIVPNAA